MHRIKTLLLLSILAVIALPTCKNSPPEPPPPPPEPVPTITLSVEDLGVTESWLRVAISDTVSARTFLLTRDDQTVDSLFLVGPDTVLLDEGLEPDHAYTYAAYRLDDGLVVDSTDSVQVTTLDTTSHEFTWEIFEFGDYSSSLLLDVAIINENDIWAVGEIFLNDSTGQPDPHAYNLARWDGSTWDVIKVQFPACDANGNEIGTNSYGGTSILAVSESDIWITCIGSLVHWDGVRFSRICMSLGYGERNLTAMWGKDGEIYLGGTNGFLGHRVGSVWEQIESGTTLDINDIFGSENEQSGETEILAVAAREFETFDRKILRITGTSAEGVSDTGIPGSLQSVWFKPGQKYYVAGNGLYSKRTLNAESPWTDEDAAAYYLYRMRGTEINDLVACGTFGEIVHFNGVSWRSYRSETGLSVGLYRGLAIKGNLVVAVGFDGTHAVITRGVRSAPNEN